MNLQLTDKVVLITGGAKGIGEGITRAFAAEGAIAVILGRNPEEARTIVEDLTGQGLRADSLHAEMTEEEDIRSAVAGVLAKHGRIDVLVNNAGTNDAVSLRRPPAEFAASLHKNLVPAFTLVHHALEALVASGGNIVNISSKTADTGQGGTSGYAASKGGLNALTREWALGLSKYGIRVNCVAPAEVIAPLYEQWLAKTPDPVTAREQIEQTVPFGSYIRNGKRQIDQIEKF